jgi:hypothetical protein
MIRVRRVRRARRVRRVRGAVLAVAAAVVGSVALVAPAPEANAQTSTARAVVIVDLGSLGGGVHTTVIDFDGTVSGLQALQLAGASPGTITYGALGQAVCTLYGAGDPLLPGHCPGGWTYFRAYGGAGGWSQSGLGASITTVHDGDVEGWRYGGGAPPFQSFCAVVGCAPPAPAPTVAPPVVANGSGNPPASGAAGAPASGGDGATTPGSPSGSQPGATAVDPAGPANAAVAGAEATTTPGTTAPGRSSGAEQERGREVAAGPSAGGGAGGGGSPVGIAIAAVVLVALAGGGVLLRRRRAAT